MKLSTRLKKYVSPDLLFGDSNNTEYTCREIVLMVGGSRKLNEMEFRTYSLEMADEYHRYLTKDEHCILLPLNECPVVSENKVVMHYASVSYKDWCEN